MKASNKQHRYEKGKNRNSLHDFKGSHQLRHASEKTNYGVNNKSRLPQPRHERDDRYSSSMYGSRNRESEPYGPSRKRLLAPKKPPRSFAPTYGNDYKHDDSELSDSRVSKRQTQNSAFYNNKLTLPQPATNRRHSDGSAKYHANQISQVKDQRIPVPVPRKKKINSDSSYEFDNAQSSNNGRVKNKPFESANEMRPKIINWHNSTSDNHLRQPEVPLSRHAPSHRNGNGNNTHGQQKLNELPRPTNPHLQEKGNERFSSFVEYTPPEIRRNTRHSMQDHHFQNVLEDASKSTNYSLRLPVPKPRPKSEPFNTPHDVSAENMLSNKEYEKVLDAFSKLRRSNNSTPEYAVVKKWKKFKGENNDEINPEHVHINVSQERPRSIRHDAPDDIKVLQHALFRPDYHSDTNGRSDTTSKRIHENVQDSHELNGPEQRKSKYKNMSEELKLSDEASKELKNLKFKKLDGFDSDSDYSYMSPYTNEYKIHRETNPHRSYQDAVMPEITNSHDNIMMHARQNRLRNAANNFEDQFEDDTVFSHENTHLIGKKPCSSDVNFSKTSHSLHPNSDFDFDDNDSEVSAGYQSLSNFRKSLSSNNPHTPKDININDKVNEHVEHKFDNGKMESTSNRDRMNSHESVSDSFDYDTPKGKHLALNDVSSNDKDNEGNGTSDFPYSKTSSHNNYALPRDDQSQPEEKEIKSSYSFPTSSKNTEEAKSKVVKEEDPEEKGESDPVFETLMLDGYEDQVSQPLLTSTHNSYPDDFDYEDVPDEYDGHEETKMSDKKQPVDKSAVKDSTNKSPKEDGKKKNHLCKFLEGLGMVWDCKPTDECPWGRCLDGVRNETFEELKRRFHCRTVFVTPTFADGLLDNQFTEINFDKFHQMEESRPSFVSRSFEKRDKSATDIEIAEEKASSDCKSGMNVKLYCKGCGKFESKECNGPPPARPPSPNTSKKSKKSKKANKKANKKAPKAKKEKLK